MTLLRSPIGRALLTALVAFAAMTVVRQVREPDTPPSPVVIDDAWSRPTPPGVDVTAVYLELRAIDGDTLVGVAVDSAVAAAVGVHRNLVAADGQTSMEHVDRLELPAGATVALTPAGELHLMVEGLTRPLVEDDRFELTFTFAAAGDLAATVTVSPANG